MSNWVIGVASAAAMLWAASANAGEIYTVHLVGHITGSSSPDFPALSVGDEVVLDAQFSDDLVARNFGGASYNIAGTGAYAVNGLTDTAVVSYADWQIRARDFVWTTGDDLAAGPTRFFYEHYEYEHNYVKEYSYTRSLTGPQIVFEDGKVLGVGLIAAFYGHGHPAIHLGAGGAGRVVDVKYENYCGGDGSCDAHIHEFTAPGLSSSFSMGPSIYYRDSPDFTGEWDFSSSWVSVPEPSSWALFILGFGGAGTMFRWRRRTAAA